MHAESTETPTGENNAPNPPAPAAEAAAPRSHVATWLTTLLRPVHALIMRLYFRVEVTGRERIPADGPVVIAPTHRSRWDTLALYCATGRLMRFLTSENEIAGFQGWFIRRLGAFPINTRRPNAGALRHCRELILAGQPLVIFPEGALCYIPPDHVHPLKPGVAWLTLDCQERCPEIPLAIVPIRLKYGDLVLKFRSRILVEVREPIPLAPYLEMPRKQAIVRLTADLQAALGDVVDTTPPDFVARAGGDAR